MELEELPLDSKYEVGLHSLSLFGEDYQININVPSEYIFNIVSIKGLKKETENG